MSAYTFSSDYHGEKVETLLSDSSKDVSFHSEFKSGVNVKVGDDLLYISYPYFQIPPFGLMLRKEVMDYIKPLFKEAKLSFHQGRLVIGNFQLTIENSREASTYIQKKELKTDLFLELLEVYVKQSPLIEYSLNENLEKLVKELIGFGQGLTPSGDDFIVGLLALNSRINFLPSSIFSVIEKKINDKQTTDVSIAYLKSALEGQYSTAVVEVMNELDNPVRLSKALELLAQTGHTSGKDTIYGMYYGLTLIQK